MGQAWCKEKSTKVQDSKSPLDRVFLRCAHRIYPGLKDEGSVLSGATQRVTSSEIGYASSPPRDVLTRGQSIDSVDRPFHPNDWVDVNLEVPGTPTRPSSVMTNLTLDTTLYPPTTLNSTNSSVSKVKDFTPVPPPRRRKKNRGRPLPPKPDEVSRTHVDRVTTSNCFKDSRNSCHEPLYSSVKSHKTRSSEKEVFEHKVNGTGKIISNIVLASKKSNRKKSSREEKISNNFRPNNSSTVSLPNYSELKITNDSLLCEDEDEIKVHKIIAAESLPSLITSGALECLKNSDNEKKKNRTIDDHDKNERKHSIDEVDFSLNENKNEDTINSIGMIEGPRITSTPVKNEFEDNSGTGTISGGWFLHQERASKSNESEEIPRINSEEKLESEKIHLFDCKKNGQSDVFIETEEDPSKEDNRKSEGRATEDESMKQRRTRMNLKRTLSNESEPFESHEEKELRESESIATSLRSNCQVKVFERSISEESLPREMLVDSEDTNFFVNEKKSSTNENKINNKIEKKQLIEESIKDDTKTPPPSPEPKIKPEIFDNDHSTLLKVLRDEAEESNLSSMTPSLTELEAALSDMLEREDAEEKSELKEIIEKMVSIENIEAEKSLEKPIEPRMIDVEKNIMKSVKPVSLKNILGSSEKSSAQEKAQENFEDDRMVEIDLGNDEKYLNATQNKFVDSTLRNSSRGTISALEPPEKPSRLHQMSLERSLENSGSIPTPPRRRNRSSASGHSTTVLRENGRRSNERTATSENPYPNDRLI